MHPGSIAAQHRDTLRIRIDHRRGHAKALLCAGGDGDADRFERQGRRDSMSHQSLAVHSRRRAKGQT